ncbi:MAG: ATP-binding protein, partial [Ekhidna sp.]
INFEPEASQLIVTDVVKSLEEATKSLKAFSMQLRPGILDSLGISEAISWLVDEFAKKSGTKVKKQIESNGVTLDNSTSNAIFRICQETLNNIAKHANATLIEVGFYIDDEEVTLSIIDNGVGMRDSSLNDPFSMGLLGMKERAHLAGGSLEIESDEGKYTKVKYHQLLTAENE